MANALAYTGYLHAPSGSADFTGQYTATFSGSYVNGTGESLNFLTASNTNGIEGNGDLPNGGTSTSAPFFCTNLSGYDITVTALTAGLLTVKFFSAAGTELGSGAYPAGISGGTIMFQVRSRV